MRLAGFLPGSGVRVDPGWALGGGAASRTPFSRAVLGQGLTLGSLVVSSGSGINHSWDAIFLRDGASDGRRKCIPSTHTCTPLHAQPALGTCVYTVATVGSCSLLYFYIQNK